MMNSRVDALKQPVVRHLLEREAAVGERDLDRQSVLVDFLLTSARPAFGDDRSHAGLLDGAYDGARRLAGMRDDDRAKADVDEGLAVVPSALDESGEVVGRRVLLLWLVGEEPVAADEAASRQKQGVSLRQKQAKEGTQRTCCPSSREVGAQRLTRNCTQTERPTARGATLRRKEATMGQLRRRKWHTAGRLGVLSCIWKAQVESARALQRAAVKEKGTHSRAETELLASPSVDLTCGRFPDCKHTGADVSS